MDVIWSANLDLEIAYVNPACHAVTGYTPEEWVGKSLRERCDPDDFARMRQWLSEELAKGPQGKGGRFETAILHKTGARVPVEVHCRVIYNDYGLPMSVQGVARDLTERKRVEAERDRLLLALEQAAESYILTDPEGTILYVNGAFEQQTGYARQDAVGRNPRFLQSGRHARAFYEDFWETLVRGETWKGCFVNRCKDGTLRSEETAVTPVRDRGGQLLGYIAVKSPAVHWEKAG